MKFAFITIYLTDLESSIKFYEDIIGLKVIRRFPAGPGHEIAFMGNGALGETQKELLCHYDS